MPPVFRGGAPGVYVKLGKSPVYGGVSPVFGGDFKFFIIFLGKFYIKKYDLAVLRAACLGVIVIN